MTAIERSLPAPRSPVSQPDPRRPPGADRAGRQAAALRRRRRLDLAATVEIHSPRFYRAMLGGSVGLGEAYRDGVWDCDDLVALVRIAVPQPGTARPPGAAGCTRCSSPLRADAVARSAQQQACLAPPHLGPLRPRQRPLRPLSRRVDDVLVGSLPQPGGDPRRSPGAPAGADLPGAGARARRPPARDRHRLGRDGRLRGEPLRLPGHHHDDLGRAARGSAPPDPGRRRRGSRHGPARGLPRPARPLLEARLAGDDRGGRLAVLRRSSSAAARSCSSPTASSSCRRS